MAFVNYNNKEITVKIVYYGPALSGKTTCLKYIYISKDFEKKGKLITLDTDGDRTLFFDFLPIEVGKLGDYSIKIQLYTVPGQVAYNTTRKLVLQGADGVVFIADSQVIMRKENLDNYNNLKENLRLNTISFSDIPIIFQYNKRDLKETLPNDQLNEILNPENKPFFPTIATTGEGVVEALQTIMKNVIVHLKNKLSIFQRDKTVMFSREELTAQVPPKKFDMQLNKMDIPDFNEMTDYESEEEEMLELSSPLEKTDELEKSDSPDILGESNKEEDIFNLGDDSILDNMDSELEVPEVVMEDELAGLKDPVQDEPVSYKLEEDVLEGGGGEIYPPKREEITVHLDSSTKTFDLPINIEIPEDKDEIRIDLSLKIVVKKK
jgi:small GTP-binding protein